MMVKCYIGNQPICVCNQSSSYRCVYQMFRGGEKILDRQRYQFPPAWVYVDNVEGEWGAFNEIMKRKDSAMQSQIGSLQMKIVAEDKVVEQKTQDLLAEWEKGKPVQVYYTYMC